MRSEQRGAYSVLIDECARLRERCEDVTHPSGLRIRLIPKPMMQTYVMLSVDFGARDTSYTYGGKRVCLPDGVAHFLEHKMFAGPDGTDANEKFSALGAEANAWTDYDTTAYLFSTAEDPVPPLRVLLDMVFTPYFTKESVSKEQGIIQEEISMGEDDPWQQLYEQSMRATYAKHPLRKRICGTAASISRITPRMLYACHEAFYRPEYMCLTVCGSVSMSDLVAQVDAQMARLPAAKTPAPIRREVEEPAKTPRRRTVRRARVSQPLFQITLKDTALPEQPKERLYRETAVNLISEMLFSRAAPFYGELFEQGLITPGYSYGYSSAKGAAYHALTGEARDVQAIWEQYVRVIERSRREGLSAEDFERCRRVLYASFVSQFDYPEDIADLAGDCEQNGFGVFDALDCIERVSLQELQALLEELFLPEASVLSVLLPDSDKVKEENENVG